MHERRAASGNVRRTSQLSEPALLALLLLIAVMLLATHLGQVQPAGLTGPTQAIAGILAGVAIGVVAAIMGVAGGELLVPTIILLYGTNIKVAGSLSLAVSLPTMLVAFARYSQDKSFTVLTQNKTFLIAMATGSVIGVIAGGALLGVVPTAILIPLLALLLVLSAKKVWGHG